MKRMIFILVTLAIAVPAHALERGTVKFLESAAKAKVERDLWSAVEQSFAGHTSSEVWRDALQIMRDRQLDTFTRYSIVARLMSAAVLLSGQTADDLPLERLTPEDVSAMVYAVGFPDESDLIRYLLARGPSLRIASLRGGYTAIRLAPERQSRVLLERADQPLLDLGPGFSRRTLAPENDLVAKPTSERAKTRRATLASIPPIVIAAKAYRTSERAALADKPYATLIALEALEEAVAADPRNMRIAGYNGHIKAEKTLVEAATAAPLSPELAREQTEILLKLPTSAFFARLFDEAAQAYANTDLPQDDRRGRVWKLWGVAISRFAAREDASTDLQSFVDSIDESVAPFAHIALRFFDALPAKDALAFSDLPAWRDKLQAAIVNSSLDQRERYRVDLDFIRIMETIARPDVAGQFLMLRITEMRGQPLETEYLYRFAPFVRDYCNLISFRISRHGAWIRRSGAGYEPLMDFLDNFHPSGRLTQSGEIVLPSPGKIPYPALNPEEDCAVIFAASGVAEGLLTPGTNPTVSADFEDWVQQAFERNTPSPSLAPYLKLLFVDWFASAFEALRTRSLRASEYRYTPLDATPLASPAFARALLGRAAMPAEQRETLQLFLQTRRFLEDNYLR